MITLDLPSSGGTLLCPDLAVSSPVCQSAGRVLRSRLWWVSVSAARKLEEGSIRDIKTDVTLAPGPVGTQGLTLKQNQWYQWTEYLHPQPWICEGLESSGSVCEVEVSGHRLGESLTKMIGLTMTIWLWRILLSSVQIFMFIWLTGLWQTYG